MQIEKYSFGIGDRFAKEGRAQLKAIQEINKLGYPVVPVWNKSHREHTIVKTTQASVLKEAEDAVKARNWAGNYYVDADHIGMGNVNGFIDNSNFFTIDVAHLIGKQTSAEEKEAFVKHHTKYLGDISFPGIDESYHVNEQFLESVADKYIEALKEVFIIYNHIANHKGSDKFIPEVSMDECDIAQTPLELFFILAELKRIGVEVQTIAPKFTGLFAKGVDYVGDVAQFAREFEQDVAVVEFAKKELNLPESLKLSVHSGSDKFSIYPAIKKAIQKFNAGIHVKTAGTTWLEEVIGLAEAGGNGLEVAKQIYQNSLNRFDELIGPYASVLQIDTTQLPSIIDVNKWNSKQFTDALVHDRTCSDYNPNFRQLIHVGYKIAVEMGDRYLEELDRCREVIEKNVTYNLFERHLRLLFG